MKNKLLKLLTLVLLVMATLAFSFACSSGDTSGNNGNNTATVEIQAVYDMYVAYAEENGVTPKSYEEWLDTIKGKDGLNGVGVKSATINADGELIVTLTDGKELNLGIVKGKDGKDGKDGQDYVNQNTQCLDFFPLDDGTYGVKAGNACYLSEIRIPATYDGKPVTKILEFFFDTSIPAVKTIVIPEGVKVICDYAFENVYGRIPIESIIIPKSVIEIGESAFDCVEDAKVYYNGTLEEWANIDFKDAWANPMCCGGELYVKGQKIENVDFSNKSMNPYAFTGCKSLKSIKLPTNLTEISYRMFYNCSSLTSIEIPNSVTSIGDWAFGYCSSLESVTIGEKVESIGYEAFYNCSSLTSIEIPNSVTSIGDSAFSNCRALETINFNATACADFDYGFEYAGQDGDGITVIFGNNVTKIPDRIFYSGNYSNENHSPKITSVTIGEKVASIGENAFYNCRSIVKVNYLGTIDKWIELRFAQFFYGYSLYINGVLVTDVALTAATEISQFAFYGCSSLKNVTIGENVESIGSKAFYGCKALENISFNATACADFGYNDMAFSFAGQDGDGITVIFGDNVTRIPAEIFESHYYSSNENHSPKITSVTIGETVESIGREAFYNCNLLTSIVIPNSVTSIESWAFDGCTSLTIYCEASEIPSGWDSYWNGGCPVVWGYTGE